MTEKASKFVNAYVQSIVDDNLESFEDALLNGVRSDMEKDQILTKMIFNSVRLSTTLAVQIILSILEEKDIVKISSDERLLQKLTLMLYTDTSGC